MRRIRIVVVLLGVALALPTGLLVLRTLRGVAAEKAARHRTVAERVFDEMERSLSRFLETEEDRPWADYRDGRIGAEGPDFVVGHFQLAADGRIHVPSRAAVGEAVAERVESVVARDLASRRSGAERPTAGIETQAPGTTAVAPTPAAREPLRALGYALGQSKQAEAPKLEAADAPGEAVAKKSDRAYDAIQSLNLGVEQRRQRARKIVEEARSEVYGQEASSAAPRRDAEEDADLSGLARDYAVADERDAPAVAGRRPAAPPSASPAAAAEPKRARSNEGLARRVADVPGAEPPGASGGRADPGTVQIAVDPLHGRVVGNDHLLLSRAVWIGERGVRQGLVLDRAALGGWLRDRVFAPLALPGADLRFGGASGRGTPEGYVYVHRFAEPFQGLTAELTLAPLADVGGEGSIYLLATLLVLVGAAGLWAIHRSVAVTLGFAERRSNFVAAVTHELRTPLTSIRMYAEMLRDDIVPDETKRREYYRTISAESERLGRLIDNVLEFSRLEKGTREMNLVPGDLGAAVREVTERVRPHAEAEGFALEVAIEPGLPPVRFDRDALLQVLFNLVDNAVKYAAEAKQRRIRVECSARPGGEGVELRVRDHGPGVPARHLKRVFEPFYRGEDELTRRSKGTGLGLALVKGLAERMGAAIQGANAEGGGFEVRIAF